MSCEPSTTACTSDTSLRNALHSLLLPPTLRKAVRLTCPPTAFRTAFMRLCNFLPCSNVGHHMSCHESILRAGMISGKSAWGASSMITTSKPSLTKWPTSLHLRSSWITAQREHTMQSDRSKSYTLSEVAIPCLLSTRYSFMRNLAPKATQMKVWGWHESSCHWAEVWDSYVKHCLCNNMRRVQYLCMHPPSRLYIIHPFFVAGMEYSNRLL